MRTVISKEKNTERIQTVIDFFYDKSIGIVRKETLEKVYGARARKPLQLHSLYARKKPKNFLETYCVMSENVIY